MTIKEVEKIINNDELLYMLERMHEAKKNDAHATIHELETRQKARKNKCREFIELLNNAE